MCASAWGLIDERKRKHPHTTIIISCCRKAIHGRLREREKRKFKKMGEQWDRHISKDMDLIIVIFMSTFKPERHTMWFCCSGCCSVLDFDLKVVGVCLLFQSSRQAKEDPHPPGFVLCKYSLPLVAFYHITTRTSRRLSLRPRMHVHLMSHQKRLESMTR